jgi:hypothetical protein
MAITGKFVKYLDGNGSLKKLIYGTTQAATTDELVPLQVALGVRKDTPAGVATDDGDFQPSTSDSTGRTWVRERVITRVSATPTVSASPAYSTGDAMGGKQTYSTASFSAGAGHVRSVTVVDLSATVPDLDVIFFSADPSGTTFTDNSALDVADADVSKIIGMVKLRSANWVAFADNAVAYAECTMPFQLSSGTSLYAAIVCRSAVTLTSTSDIVVTLGVEKL